MDFSCYSAKGILLCMHFCKLLIEADFLFLFVLIFTIIIFFCIYILLLFFNRLLTAIRGSVSGILDDRIW